METELFSWSGWDGEPECMCFYDAILKQRIEEFPIGTKFDVAWIHQKPETGEGTLQFCKFGEEINGVGEVITVAEFKLHYRVGERL